jgi:hypothetical protein
MVGMECLFVIHCDWYFSRNREMSTMITEIVLQKTKEREDRSASGELRKNPE